MHSNFKKAFALDGECFFKIKQLYCINLLAYDHFSKDGYIAGILNKIDAFQNIKKRVQPSIAKQIEVDLKMVISIP